MTADATKPNGPEAAGSPSSPPPQPRESISLKRGREGSVEHFANETPSITPIAAKKNRVGGDHIALDASENEEDSGSQSASAPNAKEGHTVGEVRRKVQEMGWKEGEPKPADEAADPDTADQATADATEEAGDKEVVNDAAEDEDKNDKEDRPTTPTKTLPAETTTESIDSPSLKRKASEVATSEDKKHKSTSPTPVEAKDTAPGTASDAPAAPAKKPQATFGSFSAKASPFASASSSSSPFGAASSPSPFGSAVKSSPFGTAAKSKSALDAAPKASPFASSGFGNYSSSASPFAKKPADVEVEKEAAPSSFGDILKDKGEETTDDNRLHLERREGPTGEEDEDTIFSTRAKLFVMETEGSWKERGVGQLKINKRRDDGAARLIMRAEGVLRLILNAKLYVGMQCLEDGKHVRSTVFEDGERRFITIRTANPKIAQEFREAVLENTPLEARASASKSPQPENQA